MRQQFAAAREEPEIGPGIEIVLNRQQENVFFSAAIAQLHAIRVLLPCNVAEQFPIGGTKRDEVAAATVIRPEDQFLRRQLHERTFDIGGAKPRAIPAHGDHFVISKLGDLFDRVLKARGEIPSGLAVNMRPCGARISRRREKMNIHVR